MVFPTSEGNLEFEWSADTMIVMDIDLAMMKGTLYTEDSEYPVDLRGEEGWILITTEVGKMRSDDHGQSPLVQNPVADEPAGVQADER